MKLTAFENKIIKAILDNNIDKIANSISNQYYNLTVENRQHTGTGIYVHLASKIDFESNNINMHLGGIYAEIDGLINGAGFVLYIKNGLISLLECFSYDEFWPTNELSTKHIYRVTKEGNLEQIE
jgi:hypothetical protein